MCYDNCLPQSFNLVPQSIISRCCSVFRGEEPENVHPVREGDEDDVSVHEVHGLVSLRSSVDEGPSVDEDNDRESRGGVPGEKEGEKHFTSTALYSSIYFKTPTHIL